MRAVKARVVEIYMARGSSAARDKVPETTREHETRASIREIRFCQLPEVSTRSEILVFKKHWHQADGYLRRERIQIVLPIAVDR